MCPLVCLYVFVSSLGQYGERAAFMHPYVAMSAAKLLRHAARRRLFCGCSCQSSSTAACSLSYANSRGLCRSRRSSRHSLSHSNLLCQSTCSVVPWLLRRNTASRARGVPGATPGIAFRPLHCNFACQLHCGRAVRSLWRGAAGYRFGHVHTGRYVCVCMVSLVHTVQLSLLCK